MSVNNAARSGCADAWLLLASALVVAGCSEPIRGTDAGDEPLDVPSPPLDAPAAGDDAPAAGDDAPFDTGGAADAPGDASTVGADSPPIDTGPLDPTMCDPVRQTGCPTGTNCAVDLRATPPDRDCYAIGTGVWGTICTSNENCALGFGCVPTTSRCARWCVTGDDCPGTERNCTLTSPRADPYGVCTP